MFSRRRIGACLFDLDGTLIDSESVWIDAQVAYLRRLGIEALRTEVEAIAYGHAWQDIFQEFDRRWLHGTVTRKEMEAETTAFFNDYTETHDIVIQSSVSLLNRFHAEGLRIGIVTGSTRSRIDAFLRDAGLADRVSCTVAEGDYQRGKPAPDSYRAALARLALPADACLAFEDSPAGVAAAKAAGLLCVGLCRRPDVCLDGADRVLQDLSDFTWD